jgi:hypothetical protein
MEELLSYVHSLRDEIEKLKSELEIRPPPKKRRVVEERIQCKGATSKGGPCRNNALCGSEYCKMHGENNTRPEKPKKEPKVTTPKPKKVIPEHCHACGVSPATECQLCQTHGDVLDPNLPREDFVGEDDEMLIRSLAILWASENTQLPICS